MTRLKVRQVAEAQGLTLSELQRRTLLNFGALRRYWFNTSNGKEDGPPLELISLSNLNTIALALNVQPNDLIEFNQEEIMYIPMLVAA